LQGEVWRQKRRGRAATKKPREVRVSSDATNGATSDAKPAPSGRLAGAKSATYVRAVNEPEARASRFTARYMLASDIAYVLSAAELGVTPAQPANHLLSALVDLLEQIEALDTSFPPSDVVAQREAWITEKVGRADAAWLHLGRNRGESLRCYLPRLYFRQVLFEERQAVVELIGNLLKRAGPTLEEVTPNYHHLQHSGFSTLGEYLLSWVAVLEPHLERFEAVDRRLNRGPSAFGSRAVVKALYDRVSWRLGFTRRARLRRDGIWVHDQFTEPFFALSLVALDLARLAQDLRVWMTPEFGLFELADEHAGGSSALPHAKVPFGLQAVIGGAAMAATRLAGEMTAAINPSEGSEPIYHSASLYGTAADIVAWTRYMADVIDKGKFNLDEMRRKSTFDYAGSSEAHDRLVYDFGVPFRTGHRVLGALVRSHHLGEPPPDLAALLQAETGRDIAVDQDEILDIVLGKKLLPSTFDFDGMREVWSGYARNLGAAAEAVTGPSPVERAIDALVEEAKAWLAGPAEPQAAP
jgi:argininosuccinate lyase